MPRVLITGATGPVGSSLAEYLVQQPNLELSIFKRWRSDARALAAVQDRVRIYEGDIEDAFAVSDAIQQAQPDYIFHLAAQSYPAASWGAPVVTMRANVEGTIHVLEAVRRFAPQAKVHIAGSSAQYGVVPLRPSRLLSNNRCVRPRRMVSAKSAKSCSARSILTVMACIRW